MNRDILVHSGCCLLMLLTTKYQTTTTPTKKSKRRNNNMTTYAHAHAQLITGNGDGVMESEKECSLVCLYVCALYSVHCADSGTVQPSPAQPNKTKCAKKHKEEEEENAYANINTTQPTTTLSCSLERVRNTLSVSVYCIHMR